MLFYNSFLLYCTMVCLYFTLFCFQKLWFNFIPSLWRLTHLLVCLFSSIAISPIFLLHYILFSLLFPCPPIFLFPLTPSCSLRSLYCDPQIYFYLKTRERDEDREVALPVFPVTCINIKPPQLWSVLHSVSEAALMSADDCHLTFNSAVCMFPTTLWGLAVYTCLCVFCVCACTRLCIHVFVNHTCEDSARFDFPLGPPGPQGALGGERSKDSSFVWTWKPPPPAPSAPAGPAGAMAVLFRAAILSDWLLPAYCLATANHLSRPTCWPIVSEQEAGAQNLSWPHGSGSS